MDAGAAAQDAATAGGGQEGTDVQAGPDHVYLASIQIPVTTYLTRTCALLDTMQQHEEIGPCGRLQDPLSINHENTCYHLVPEHTCKLTRAKLVPHR